MQGFESLLKFLHILVAVIAIAILGWSIYITVTAWPEKPAFDPKLIWIPINVGLAILFAFLLNKASHYRPHIQIKKHPKAPLTPEKIAALEFWRSIRDKAFSGNPDQMKMAILEADKFVGQALTNVGFTGENTEQKVQQILSDDIGWIRRAALKATRYRNKIMEESDFKIETDEIKTALQNYELLLKELGVLDPIDL